MPRRLALAALLLLAAGGAHAHEAAGVAGGLVAGLSHPVLGPDHLLAMLAVGLWGAQIGGAQVWTLPVAFPLVMSLGAALGIAGVTLPAVEPAIALSVLVLGLAILAAWKAPAWAALGIAAAFALFHGHAHGVELPGLADPVAYGAGFVAATGAIHCAGILIGRALQGIADGWLARGLGGAIGAAGLWFLAG